MPDEDEGRLLRLQTTERVITVAEPGDDALGPLKDLPGKWKSEGRGWNMIALPFVGASPNTLDYRLLLNQYDETLNFTFVDKGVPNRGVNDTQTKQTDQFVVTLDYEQVIHQVAATDCPKSTEAGESGLAIHHEPGLFLNMANLTTDEIDVARLASIPHGNSALALGTHSKVVGVAQIPSVNGLPVGVKQSLDNPYLAPYKHFKKNPFFGTVTDPEFPGFDPVEPHRLLTLANQDVNVQETTVLETDTTTKSGGISNIPFIKKQADATAMKSTFWIQKLADTGKKSPRFRLQYLQIVNLEFFPLGPLGDGPPKRIIWPHVSINTLDKV